MIELSWLKSKKIRLNVNFIHFYPKLVVSLLKRYFSARESFKINNFESIQEIRWKTNEVLLFYIFKVLIII